jgi:hypothetical protein
MQTRIHTRSSRRSCSRYSPLRYLPCRACVPLTSPPTARQLTIRLESPEKKAMLERLFASMFSPVTRAQCDLIRNFLTIRLDRCHGG